MSNQQIYIDSSARKWISLLEFSPNSDPLKAKGHDLRLRKGDLYHFTCINCGQPALANTFIDRVCQA